MPWPNNSPCCTYSTVGSAVGIVYARFMFFLLWVSSFPAYSLGQVENNSTTTCVYVRMGYRIITTADAV
jgi:hypothetical protein